MTDLVIYKTENRVPCSGNIIIPPQKHAQMRLARENTKNLLDKILLILGQAQQEKQEENQVSSLQNQSIHFSIWFLQTISNNPFLKGSLKALISAVSAYDISQYFFCFLNYSFDLHSFWLHFLTIAYCVHSLFGVFFQEEERMIRAHYMCLSLCMLGTPPTIKTSYM